MARWTLTPGGIFDRVLREFASAAKSGDDVDSQLQAIRNLIQTPGFQTLIHSQTRYIYEDLVRNGTLLPRTRFTASDDKAMDFLARSDLFYLEKAVNSATLRTIEESLDRLDNLAERVLTTTVTRARNFGQVNGMRTAGVKTFSVSGPDDSKTCGYCKEMLGREFTLEQEITQMDNLITAGPENLDAVKPFLKGAMSLGTVSDSTDEELQALGFATPPYHPGCRHGLSVVSFYANLDDVPYPIG